MNSMSRLSMATRKTLPTIKTRLLSENGKPPYQNRLDSKKVSTSKYLPISFKVFCIISSEFCERFSYYGLRAVLVLYLSSELLMNEDSATSVYHGWTFLCYFTPIFGAILADSFQGRFRTIFVLSVVYLFGNVVLSLAATKPLVPHIPGKRMLSGIGLVLIAFGTGGIKPCVSAFGGDQFDLPQQAKQLAQFFSIFYFSINAGSLLSTLLTPVLREDVSCFGGECFTLAFGVPAVLMLIALILFLVGSRHYKIVPPEGNVAAQVVYCILYAGWCRMKKAFQKRDPRDLISLRDLRDHGEKPHWLHLSEGRFSHTLIRDVKTLLQVLFLFIPLPLFWALFDQQGSRWTFQATKLSGSIGSWTVKPDQIQVLNPLLILLLIPFFESVIYPLLSSFNLLTKPLHRMFVGGLLACLAFVVSGILQVAIENTEMGAIPQGRTSLTILNTLPCPIEIETPLDSQRFKVAAFDLSLNTMVEKHLEEWKNGSSNLSADFEFKLRPIDQSFQCKSILNGTKVFNNNLILTNQHKDFLLVVASNLGSIEVVMLPESLLSLAKSSNGMSYIRIIDSTDFLRLSAVLLRHGNETRKVENNSFSKGISSSKTEVVPSGRYEVLLPSFPRSNGVQPRSLGFFTSSSASHSVLFIYGLTSDNKEERVMKVFSVGYPNIHMAWLLPQYFLMSVGEIMFSITGLEFSFKQAPASMKSVVQAAWLLTTAFGNLYVVIIAESKLFVKQSLEFFMFAFLMLLDMIVFYCFANNFHLNSSRNEDQNELFNEDFGEVGAEKEEFVTTDEEELSFQDKKL